MLMQKARRRLSNIHVKWAQRPAPIMPLTEISPNVRRHGSHSRSPGKGLPLTKTVSSLAPNAVRSMLKTTTETGDIGQFSVRPSLLPPSGPRMLALRRRSGSFDSSFLPALPRHKSRPPRTNAGTYYPPGQMPSHSTLSRQDTIRSSLTSYGNNPRVRPRNGRPYPYRIQGVASPPAGAAAPYSHRSLVTLQSQKGLSSLRSISPLGHSRRFRGPGHGATSPAYSDVLSRACNHQAHYFRSASAGTAGSSPASAFPGPVGVPGYFPRMNRSMVSFVRFPSPAIQPPHYGYRRSPFPSRTNTPISGSIREMQRSPTGSTIPQYYDYTESFVEEDCFSSNIDASVNSLPFNLDQTILENERPSNPRRAPTPFGTMPRSRFYPAELPTKHNRTTSEQSKTSAVAGSSEGQSGRAGLKLGKSPQEGDGEVSARPPS